MLTFKTHPQAFGLLEDFSEKTPLKVFTLVGSARAGLKSQEAISVISVYHFACCPVFAFKLDFVSVPGGQGRSLTLP